MKSWMIQNHPYQRHITLIMSLEIIWSWSFINLCSPSEENKSSNLFVKTLNLYFSYENESSISLNLFNLTLELWPSLNRLIIAKREKLIFIIKKINDTKLSCLSCLFINTVPEYFLWEILFLLKDFDKLSAWYLYWINQFSLSILLPYKF